MEEVINRLAEELYPIVCRDIADADWEEVKESYQKLLYRRYAKIDTALGTVDYESLYESLYESEMEEWSSLSGYIKRSLLIKDQALEEILSLSNKATRLARERYEDKKYIEKEEVDASIERLNALLDQVNLENREVARTSINEGIADFMYASNQSDVISTRLIHYL